MERRNFTEGEREESAREEEEVRKEQRMEADGIQMRELAGRGFNANND